TTLNMLGDLCVRAGKKDEAIICFVRIAEHYRDKEFTLKAIAMYKKVDRLKPRDPEIAENLAVLYATQGLIVDARAQYLIVADAYTRGGKTKQALEVLRKIADLDPHNVDIRLKLAGGYLKEGLHAEAAIAFKEAGTRLLEVGSFEKALEAYSRALELRPYDEQALAGMLSAHKSVGTADEAAELLEKTVAERPEDVELISMLAEAYIAAEDAKGAERATGMLMDLDASNYTRFIPIAQLYLKADEINETARILTSIVEPMLAGREENELLELVNEMLARNPEHVEALRLLVRIHWWQRDLEKLRAALERLAEAAQAAELPDEERYALVQLVRLAPDENRYFERLELLGGAQDEAMASTVFPPDSVTADVPSYETFAVVPEHEVSTEAPFENEFESNSVAEPTLTDPSASFAELNDSLTDSAGLARDANGTRLSGGVEFDFDGAEVSEPAAAQVAPGEPAAEESPRDAMMHQELESVDFYLSQGYFDIAADTLQLLEGQFGSHPELDARRQRLTAAMQTTAEPEVSFEMGATAPPEQPHPEAEFEFGGTFGATETAAETREPQRLKSSPSPAGNAIDSGLAEIFEEFKVASEDESFENEDYETHYNMGTAYKEMDLIDEAIQEFQTAAALSRPGDGTPRYLQCCNMLGNCFMRKDLARAAVLWFKKGLESPGHTEDEYLALRYELGLAYQQMGDIHRAIDTFTEVYGRNISYRGVAEKLKTLQEQKSESKGKKRRGGK
ncbi:MAG: tetratricopeptide repeat protein, partial [Pyrinomonadaceae bacterium]